MARGVRRGRRIVLSPATRQQSGHTGLEQEMDRRQRAEARRGLPGVRCELSFGTTAGLRSVLIENGVLRAEILLDKGANVRQIWDLASGCRLLAETGDWVDQLRRFHLSGRRGTSYSSCYEGGWQDVLPARAKWDGEAIEDGEGVGEAAIVPWEMARSLVTPGSAQLMCKARLPRCGLEVSKSFRVRRGKALISVETILHNRTRRAVWISWTQHPALGGDLLDETSLVWLPPGQAGVHRSDRRSAGAGNGDGLPAAGGWLAAGSLLPPPGASDRFATIAHIRRGEAAMLSAARGLGVRLRWDRKIFPHAWLWCARGASISCIAVEPSTTYLPELAGEPSRPVLRLLRPAESMRAWMRVSAFTPMGIGRGEGIAAAFAGDDGPSLFGRRRS